MKSPPAGQSEAQLVLTFFTVTVVILNIHTRVDVSSPGYVYAHEQVELFCPCSAFSKTVELFL